MVSGVFSAGALSANSVLVVLRKTQENLLNKIFKEANSLFLQNLSPFLCTA